MSKLQCSSHIFHISREGAQSHNSRSNQPFYFSRKIQQRKKWAESFWISQNSLFHAVLGKCTVEINSNKLKLKRIRWLKLRCKMLKFDCIQPGAERQTYIYINICLFLAVVLLIIVSDWLHNYQKICVFSGKHCIFSQFFSLWIVYFPQKGRKLFANFLIVWFFVLYFRARLMSGPAGDGKAGGIYSKIFFFF